MLAFTSEMRKHFKMQTNLRNCNFRKLFQRLKIKEDSIRVHK